MGDNGPLYGDEMRALEKATSNVGELFLVNDHAPVSWQDESNHALAEAARDWPHTTLIDWHSAAESRHGLTWDDIHLTPAGAGVYARLVATAVHAELRGSAGPRRSAGPRQSRR
jgi:transposase